MVSDIEILKQIEWVHQSMLPVCLSFQPAMRTPFNSQIIGELVPFTDMVCSTEHRNQKQYLSSTPSRPPLRCNGFQRDTFKNGRF